MYIIAQFRHILNGKEIETYNTLNTLPVFRYFEIKETGNYNYLYKIDIDKIKLMPIKKNDRLKEIFDFFIFEFDTLNLENIKIEANILRLNLLVSVNENDVKSKNELNKELKKQELIKPEYGQKDFNLDNELIILSKWIGYRLDKFTLTTKEYLKIRELYSKEAEKLNNK